jgi:hypothetical protein
MDAIKTWVQTTSLQAAPLSVKETFRQIYLTNGMNGLAKNLSRGWQVAYGKGIPSAALIVVSYSFVYDGLSKIL